MTLESSLEMIEIGSLLLMCSYHMTLYLQVKRNSYLYMGLVCLAVFVRALLVDDGSQFFYVMFPTISTGWGRTIEYTAAYSTLFLTPLFIYSVFPHIKFQKYTRFFTIAGFMLIGIVLFTPYTFFRSTLNVYHALMIASFVLVFIMLFRALRLELTGSRPVFWGIAVCFVFVFIEMLKNADIADLNIPGPNLVGTGVVIFLFFQSVALSSIFAKSFKENQRLNRELEERVAQRTESLSKSNVIKDNLIKIVSHDLRSPLSVLKDLLALQQSGHLSDEERTSLFKDMQTRVGTTLEMLDDLLVWASSQVNAGDFKIYPEKINLQQDVAHSLELFTSDARDKSIKVVNKVKPSITILSDKNVLSLVLRNLMTNAIKFTPVGGKVTLSADSNDELVILKVRDTGIGIPDDIKGVLFQVETRNQRPGTQNEKSIGLGLALCKELVQQNGGEIWVEDNPEGSGSVFGVSFKNFEHLRQAK